MTTTTETYAELTDLESPAAYWFQVRAVSSGDEKSAFSDMEEVWVQFATPGADMILNGDFSSGEQSWSLNTQGSGQGGGLVGDEEYHVDISDGGTELWHVQLIQGPFALIQGRRYLLEFDARASANRVIEPRVAEDGGDFTLYSQTTELGITTRMKHYSFEFEMAHETDPRARLVFNCGSSDSDCYFDNISLKELNASDSPPAAAAVRSFLLRQNYPNPFNGATTLQFYNPAASEIEISLYNIHGQKIDRIAEKYFEEGWISLNYENLHLSSGIYFCRLHGRSSNAQRTFQTSQKWIIMK